MHLRDQGRPILQQMELLASLFPLAHQAYFLHGYAFNRTMSMGNSLVTTNQYGIWYQHSPWHSKCFVKRPLSVLLVLLHTCYSQRVLWALCIFIINSWYIIHALTNLVNFVGISVPKIDKQYCGSTVLEIPKNWWRLFGKVSHFLRNSLFSTRMNAQCMASVNLQQLIISKQASVSSYAVHFTVC